MLGRVRTELEHSAADLNIQVRVISFTASPNEERLRPSRSDEDTLIAPVNALLAARMQRGVDEWKLLFLRHHGNFDAYLSLYQDNWHHHLPLGWTLSHQSLTFIKRHFGVPSDCSYTERFWEMLPRDFDAACSFFAKRFPPNDYGEGMPEFRPRDLDVKDAICSGSSICSLSASTWAAKWARSFATWRTSRRLDEEERSAAEMAIVASA